MKVGKQTLVSLLTLVAILAWSIGTSHAGDEDMLSPYAEFDPETGFFLGPDGQIAGSGAEGMPPGESPAATPSIAGDAAVPIGEAEVSDSGSGLPVLVPGIIILMAAFIYGFRRYRYRRHNGSH